MSPSSCLASPFKLHIDSGTNSTRPVGASHDSSTPRKSPLDSPRAPVPGRPNSINARGRFSCATSIRPPRSRTRPSPRDDASSHRPSSSEPVGAVSVISSAELTGRGVGHEHDGRILAHQGDERSTVGGDRLELTVAERERPPGECREVEGGPLPERAVVADPACAEVRGAVADHQQHRATVGPPHGNARRLHHRKVDQLRGHETTGLRGHRHHPRRQCPTCMSSRSRLPSDSPGSSNATAMSTAMSTPVESWRVRSCGGPSRGRRAGCTP